MVTGESAPPGRSKDAHVELETNCLSPSSASDWKRRVSYSDLLGLKAFKFIVAMEG